MEFEVKNILFERFKKFFYEKTGQNILKYNETFLKAKIKQRLNKLGITSFREYFDKLIIDNSVDTELDELFYITINRESDFFRYQEQFEFFDEYSLPELIEYAYSKNEHNIKILSIGIALGQEPYSIAMILEENKELLKGLKVKIDAMEIVKKNIEFAKKGEYDESMLRYFLRYKEQHFKEFLNKYFISLNGNNSYQINDNLKKYIHFKKADITKNNILEKYEVIFCRNVIIYFDDEQKKEAIKKMYTGLKNGGYLFLGHSEFPIEFRDKFKTIFYEKSVVYKKMK